MNTRRTDKRYSLAARRNFANYVPRLEGLKQRYQGWTDPGSLEVKQIDKHLTRFNHTITHLMTIASAPFATPKQKADARRTLEQRFKMRFIWG